MLACLIDDVNKAVNMDMMAMCLDNDPQTAAGPFIWHSPFPFLQVHHSIWSPHFVARAHDTAYTRNNHTL
jgi:hypothetical protein